MARKAESSIYNGGPLQKKLMSPNFYDWRWRWDSNLWPQLPGRVSLWRLSRDQGWKCSFSPLATALLPMSGVIRSCKREALEEGTIGRSHFWDPHSQNWPRGLSSGSLGSKVQPAMLFFRQEETARFRVLNTVGLLAMKSKTLFKKLPLGHCGYYFYFKEIFYLSLFPS